MKYRCEKTKDEIINIVVKKFEEARDGFDRKDAYNIGKYNIMWELMHELVIYEKEEDM